MQQLDLLDITRFQIKTSRTKGFKIVDYMRLLFKKIARDSSAVKENNAAIN